MRQKWTVAGLFLVVVFIFLLAFGIYNGSTLRGSGVISGRVIAEDTGQGVAGVKVTAIKYSEIDLSGRQKKENSGLNLTNIALAKRALFSVEGITDKDGFYVLERFESGKYGISFNPESKYYLDRQEPICLALDKDETVVNKDHILRIGGSVSGAVYGSDGKEPMNGVWVTALVMGTEEGPAGLNDSTRSMQTGVSGKYLLQGLPDSDVCIITIEAPGYETLTKKVKIRKGKVTANVNFRVEKPMVFEDGATGILVSVKSAEDKSALRNIHIMLWKESKKEVGNKDGNTDENGQYSITGIPPGIYELSIFRGKSHGYWWDTKKGILVKEGKTTIVKVELNKREPKQWKRSKCEPQEKKDSKKDICEQ
jgi:hypothetical protein